MNLFVYYPIVFLALLGLTQCQQAPVEEPHALPVTKSHSMDSTLLSSDRRGRTSCLTNDREARTFLTTTRVFTQPDSTSEVVFQLPFNTEFQIVDYIDKDELLGSEYVEIKDASGRKGFIVSTELPQNSEVCYATNEILLINRHPSFGNTALIRKADANSHVVKEEYTLTCSASYSFTTVYAIALKGFDPSEKNHPFQLYKYETAMDACPGLIQTEFIFYDGQHLQLLVHGESEGEFSYAHAITPYLPYRCGNGKIIHLANGDPTTAFDTYEGTLRVTALPKKYPPANTIVLVRQDSEYLTGEDGDLVLDKNGETKKSLDSTVVEYYVWNGMQLVKQ